MQPPPPPPAQDDPPVLSEAADEAPAGEGESPRRRRQPREPRRRLSEILTDIAASPLNDRVSVADMVAAMPGRATAALLFIFAAPNALPMPPGTSALLGLPMIYMAWQMMLGRQPWLPKVVGARSMRREDFAVLVARAVPWLERAERMLRPRLPALVGGPAQVGIGVLCLVLALAVALPIPFGNMLPAFAVCLFALGVLEHDGVWVIVGAAVSAVALFIASASVFVLVRSLMFVVERVF